MKPTTLFSNHRFDLLGILLLILLLLLIVFAWPAPASSAYHAPATPTVVLPSPTPTAIPREYLESNDQTDGIILSSVVLVLIIVGGTLGVLRRKSGKGRD